MSWTEPGDVVSSWIGGDAPDDLVQVQTWIDRAERMIRSKVPGLQGRLDAEADVSPPSTELLERVRDVVVAMVTRVYRNPLGMRSAMVVSGPFTEQKTYGGDNPGSLYLSADELAALGGGRTGKAFAIDTTPLGWSMHAAVCSQHFGAAWCSCGADLTGGRGPLWEEDPWP